MINIETKKQFDESIHSEKSVCVLFSAERCPDCQVIKPVMPELEEEFAARYDFISVERDPFMDLCRELNVFGVPSFLVFQKGEEKGRFVSTARKTREEIDAFLRKTDSL